MLQDRINDLLRQFDEKYEECLQRWLHDTGMPVEEAVGRGYNYYPRHLPPSEQIFRAFMLDGQEVFRVTIDEHFAIITKWSGV